MVNAPPQQFKKFDVEEKLAQLSLATKIKLLGGKVRSLSLPPSLELSIR